MLSKIVTAAFAAFFAAAGSLAALAQQSDNLLKTIKDRGKMRVCYAEYAPWNVKNPATIKWEGVNIEIVDLIAKQLKVEVEDVDATFGTAIPSMNAQKCDFIGAAFYMSPARAEQISYTRPFATDGTTTFVTAASSAKTLAELDQPGKVIAVRSGSYEEPIAKRLFTKAQVKTLTADAGAIQLLEIAAGRADGALGSLYGNLNFLKHNPNMKVRLLNDELLSRQSIAFAVPPREYFFRDYLSTALQTMEENGQIKQIVDKWFK
jgi:ABC-type amino acid transport substrate-binding protein